MEFPTLPRLYPIAAQAYDPVAFLRARRLFQGFALMKRIVVLCDGTWNSPDIEDTTHLPELALALDIGPDQVVKYFSGVGVNDDAR